MGTYFYSRVLCCCPYKNPIVLHTDKKLTGILFLTVHCKCIYHRSAASCRNNAVQPTFQNVKQADPYTVFIFDLLFLPVFFFFHSGSPYIFDQIMIFWNWQRHWGLKIVVEQSCGQKQQPRGFFSCTDRGWVSLWVDKTIIIANRRHGGTVGNVSTP